MLSLLQGTKEHKVQRVLEFLEKPHKASDKDLAAVVRDAAAIPAAVRLVTAAVHVVGGFTDVIASQQAGPVTGGLFL